MLPALLLGILATLIAFPETPIGQALRRVLVEPFARRLNRVRPGHLTFAAILIALVTALVVLFEWEGIRLIGMAAPELVTWLGLFDAAAVLDLVAATLAFAATTRFRTVRDRMRALMDQAATTVRRIPARGRRRSRRDRPTAPRPTRSDDSDPAGWNYAFG